MGKDGGAAAIRSPSGTPASVGAARSV